MSDPTSIRQWAGEFDYPPAPSFRDADELARYLDENTPEAGGYGWSSTGPEGYEIAVCCERPTPWQAVASALAYIWTGPMRGEWDAPQALVVIPDHVYVFGVDTTKSQRDDVGDAWDQAERILVEGSPVRTTDRSGPGTKGTRAVAGVGPVLVAWR